MATVVSPERIYVSTNEKYGGVLRAQAPKIPERNYFLEPSRRDVAAAVALAFFSLEKDGVKGPFVFQWADNYVRNTSELLEAIDVGRQLIEQDPNRMVFVGEKPRYASENLGWIELGEPLGQLSGTTFFAYRSWRYRPPKAECERMLASNQYMWNSGYFVTTVEFMTAAFRSLAPELAVRIEEIVSYRGTPAQQEKLAQLYPAVPSVHFDEAILERLPQGHAVLLKVDLGWSDPGNLYSLKEALQESPEATVQRGNVIQMETKDSFLYNLNGEKLVAAMGLDGTIVIDTPDVLLVVGKDSVRHLGKLLDELAAKGYTKLL